MITGIIVFLVIMAICVAGLFSVTGVARDGPEQIVQPAFARIYGALSPRPALNVSWSYGYPAFEVVFVSKADFERAAPQNEEFKREIGRLFSHHGSMERRFDPDQAIFFNYPGRIQELLRQGDAPLPKEEPNRGVV